MRELLQAWVTVVLCVANIAVFALMYAVGADDVLNLGANSGEAVAQGEWWRLVTCMFLHAGVIHLLVNMWSLRVIGPQLEVLFGHGAYFLIYMLAGVGGSLASCLWNPGGASVGASGAIFGLFGAMIAFFLTHRRNMPNEVFRAAMKQMGLLLAINLFLGFSIPQVDNAGHLGGLVTGFVCGFAAYRAAGAPPVLDAGRFTRLALVAMILAGLVFLVPWRVSVMRRSQLHQYPPEDLRPR